MPVAVGLSVEVVVDPAGLLKLKGDDAALVAVIDGAAVAAAAEDVVAGEDPNENADVAGAAAAAVGFGALKLNPEAGEAAVATALTFGVVLGDPNDPNATVGAAGAAAVEEAWLVVLNEDPNEFAEF